MTFISPQKVFAHLDRMAAWQRGGKPAPVTIEWDLSNRCVLGCTYGGAICHFAHTHTRGPWMSRDRRLPMLYEGTGDQAHPDLVFRVLDEMAETGVRGIVWTGGGEPTTHPRWMEFVETAADRGIEQGMYTLGGLLTPKTGALLASKATWVVVSLDCATAIDYHTSKGVPLERFEAACDGVRSLVGHRATVGVSFMLHEDNWRKAPAMLELSRSLGASYTTFRPAIAEGPTTSLVGVQRDWITEALPLLDSLSQEADVECDPPRFAAYRDWTGRSYETCHGIKFNATVTPDGRVWVCPQRRGLDGSMLGDLRNESFADIWAKHPGQWTELADCRVMCRLHLLNTVLDSVYAPKRHEAFV